MSTTVSIAAVNKISFYTFHFYSFVSSHQRNGQQSDKSRTMGIFPCTVHREWLKGLGRRQEQVPLINLRLYNLLQFHATIVYANRKSSKDFSPNLTHLSETLVHYVNPSVCSRPDGADEAADDASHSVLQPDSSSCGICGLRHGQICLSVLARQCANPTPVR